MDDRPPPPERAQRSSFPLLDLLGELCLKGRDSAAYLWQVPNDEAVRSQLAGTIGQIREESAKANRREMGVIAAELEVALAASPSPQQIEILQDGFDRLTKLWQAAKSGLQNPGLV
jgi:hypothetical protein